MLSADASSVARLGSKGAELRPGETVVRNAESGRRGLQVARVDVGQERLKAKGVSAGEQMPCTWGERARLALGSADRCPSTFPVGFVFLCEMWAGPSV